MKIRINLPKTGRILIFIVGMLQPFNNVAISGAGTEWSLGFFSIVVYFIFMLSWGFNFSLLYRTYGINVYLPFVYFVLLTLMNLLNYNYLYEWPIFNTSIFFCTIFFVLILAHGIKDPMSLDNALLGFSAGSILMSVFFLSGIGVELNGPDTETRLSMFGENSNALGIYMCIGSNVLLYEGILKDYLNLRKKRFILLLFYIPIIALILATGSRTAFIIFAASIVVMLLMFPYRKRIYKLFIILIGSILAVYAFSLFMESDAVVAMRLLRTSETGSLSGRDEIWNGVLPGFYENPILGLGETGYSGVAIKALGARKSPHNVIVEILLYTGLTGLMIWMAFWIGELKSAWKVLRRQKNLLPLLMTLPILAVILSGQLLTSKWGFLLYAYILVKDISFKFIHKKAKAI